ncbi:hypothetical protein CVT26_006650 [Gymnopilus dilepis]|uniref:Uncharacterized protein n=1 Tax=Gymnopilus dilepis TaxID=231916 RepID=A0A409Y2V9_9AGAR|nr:hypothetical protein CVT26_006650 [Gymnopilus dilepis]
MFGNTRQWPQATEIAVGPSYIWEKFLYFIGVNNDEPIDENWSDGDDDESSSESSKVTDNDIDGSSYGDLKIRIQDTTVWSLDANERLMEFVRDPVTNIAVFLSSYARSAGLIWADANLECMAIIVEFYIRYLLCNNVVPSIEPSLRRSLTLVEAAKLELPAISTVAKNLPDDFSRACSHCWHWERRLDAAPLSVNAPPPSPAEEQFSTLRVGGNKALYNTSHLQGSSSPPASDGIWGHPTEDPTELFGSRIRNATVSEACPRTDNWRKPTEQAALASLLNYVDLSLTHTTGIVERSLRRIKSVHPPHLLLSPSSRPIVDLQPNAATIEQSIQSNKARIVLEPAVVGWDGGQVATYSEPEILAAPEHKLPHEHDPSRTEITLLIDRDIETLTLLKPGMGLGGTWVQVLRQDSSTLGDDENNASNLVSTFWYLDNLTVIIPSFWSVRK